MKFVNNGTNLIGRLSIMVTITMMALSGFAIARDPTANDVVNHDAHYSSNGDLSWGRGLEQAPDLSVGHEAPKQEKGSHLGAQVAKSTPLFKQGVITPDAPAISKGNIQGQVNFDAPEQMKGISTAPQLRVAYVPEKKVTITPDAIPQAIPSKAPSLVVQATEAAVDMIPNKEPTAIPARVPSNINTGSTINVAASSLKPNAPVEITDPVTNTVITVSAKTLTPSLQVAVPIQSVFVEAPRPAHNDHNKSNSHEHGTGNGPSNAQNSRSAGGLADSHVGGGKVSGGFHY